MRINILGWKYGYFNPKPFGMDVIWTNTIKTYSKYETYMYLCSKTICCLIHYLNAFNCLYQQWNSKDCVQDRNYFCMIRSLYSNIVLIWLHYSYVCSFILWSIFIDNIFNPRLCDLFFQIMFFRSSRGQRGSLTLMTIELTKPLGYLRTLTTWTDHQHFYHCSL